MALPLSQPMLKWMTGHELSLADLQEVVPVDARFLLDLRELVLKKRAIDADPSINEQEREDQCVIALIGKKKRKKRRGGREKER